MQLLKTAQARCFLRSHAAHSETQPPKQLPPRSVSCHLKHLDHSSKASRLQVIKAVATCPSPLNASRIFCPTADTPSWQRSALAAYRCTCATGGQRLSLPHTCISKGCPRAPSSRFRLRAEALANVTVRHPLENRHHLLNRDCPPYYVNWG